MSEGKTNTFMGVPSDSPKHWCKLLLGSAAAVVLFVLFFWVYNPSNASSPSVASTPQPTVASPHPESNNIKDAAARMHAGLQNASSSNVVHWQSSPEKLDAISPPLAVGLRAFSTQQNLIVEPARASAIKE